MRGDGVRSGGGTGTQGKGKYKGTTVRKGGIGLYMELYQKRAGEEGGSTYGVPLVAHTYIHSTHTQKAGDIKKAAESKKR